MSTNGKRAVSAAEPATAERKRGMAAVRETELWHLGSIIEDALREAANLAGEVYRAASNARLSRGTENATSVDEAEAVRKLEEALMCAETGEHYLRMVLDQVHDPQRLVGAALGPLPLAGEVGLGLGGLRHAERDFRDVQHQPHDLYLLGTCEVANH